MKWRSALRPVAAVSLKSPVKESPSAFQSATAWTARSGAAAPLQRRRDGQRRELCSLADRKGGSAWLTAGTRRLTSSALIAARRSHTSSKAGPSAHLRTPPSAPQNSRSTSTVSTPGSWYWAKPWSIPLRQVSCATAQRSPHHTPDDRGQAIGGLRFQAEQRRPAHETDGPRPAPHPRRATARRPLLSGTISLVPTGPAVHRAAVRTPRTHR